MAQQNLGYDDTPVIPGTPYKVHDGHRPQPRIVRPGASGTSEPPADAILLFNGVDLSNWTKQDGSPALWKVEDGGMGVVPGTGDIQTIEEFGDCQLHLEWAAPTVVKGEGQGRGNSGVFILGRYEIQVLDCFDNLTYPDGTTAAIYGQFPPLVNACREPGEWQTYDILWFSPRFDGETLLRPATVTVLHNGIAVHHAATPQGPTGHRNLSSYTPHPETGPLRLQDHGDLVRFRNIWYRPLGAYDQTA